MEYKLHHLFNYIESKPKRYCNRLARACDIESISKYKEFREKCFEMMDWYGIRLERLGCTVTMRKPGFERKVPDNEYIELPRIIVAQKGNDVTKHTLLVYGHLDVDNVDEWPEWDTDPFDMIEVEGDLIGRGPTDDKGPCVSWINVLEAFKKLRIDIPVNLKFIFEAHQESGSEGLRALLIEEKHKFLKNVDFIVISDNYWLGDETPCVTYGLRGITYFFVEIECAHYPLHSGVYGGSIAEAMSDLVFIFNSLRDYNGRVKVPHFYDDVAKLLEGEINTYYNSVDFNCEKVAASVGASRLLFKTKVENLLNRWRNPWITIHGIEGAWDKPGAKCLIPPKITGKFSCRLVPYQNPVKSCMQIKEYIEKIHEARGTPNGLRVIPFMDGHPYLGDPEDANYTAARKAVERVWKKKPDLTREGASIPAVSIFDRTLFKPICLLPLGQGSDKVHWRHEKFRRHNYIQGIKVITTYLFEVANIVLPEIKGEFSVGSPTPTPALRFFEKHLSHFTNLR